MLHGGGSCYVGGMKRGGKIKKSLGGDLMDAAVSSPKDFANAVTGKKRGGKIRKADGGDVGSSVVPTSNAPMAQKKKPGLDLGNFAGLAFSDKAKDFVTGGGLLGLLKKNGGSVKKAAGGGLYANIHAKQERIADGSKERMRKPGSKGAPTADAFKQSARTAKADGGDVEAANAIQDLMSTAQTKQSMPMPNRAKPMSSDAALAEMTKRPVMRANPAPKKAPAKVPLSEQGYIGSPEDYRMAKLAAAQNEAAVRAAGRAGAASGRDGKPYQKGGLAKFENSAKDKMQDRKLAKKYKMSPKEWEASEMDEKHDKQQSMKGLKHGGEVHHASCSCKKCGGAAYAGGGSVSDGSFEGTRPMPGGRMARKHGGRTGKGKMSVNIIIGAGGAPQGGMGGMPPMGPDGVPGNPFGPKAGMPPMPAPPPTRICCNTPSLMKASGSPFSIEVRKINPQNVPG
jgi:hypothetical protein